MKELELYLRTVHFTKSIIDVKQSTKKRKYHELLESINKENLIFKVNVNDQSIVKTDSNLKFDVLEELLFMMGTNVDSFSLEENTQEESAISLKKNFIDKEILEKRNKIAHGEGIPISADEYYAVKNFVTSFIDALSNEIIKICINEKYLVTTA